MLSVMIENIAKIYNWPLQYQVVHREWWGLANLCIFNKCKKLRAKVVVNFLHSSFIGLQ
jgi:hypothetical protein